MKKTHRAALSILLVLALLTALPLTAMAEGEGEGGTSSANDNSTPLERTTENIGTNTSEITTNVHEVATNVGTITNNGVAPAEGQKADPTSGTVNTNNNTGEITNNYGTVKNNYGEITTNSGVVGDRVPNSFDFQTDTGNFGTVGTNNQGGVVYNNAQDSERGEVVHNHGSVHNVGGTVEYNEANGTVIRNVAGSTVVNNNAGGTVQYNAAGGTVKYNHGNVGTANHQGGNGNYGNVAYNYIDGEVYNFGNGTVTKNFGTVHQHSDVTDGTHTSTTTTIYYGLSWGSDTENLNLINGEVKEGTQQDLDTAAAKVIADNSPRDGYKLTGYTWLTSDGTEVTDTANYTMNAPTWLKLVWEKIVTAVAPTASSGGGGGGGAEAVELSAGKRYIGLGSVVTINGSRYKVVEIKDDAFVVVSFDALPDEDVQDLDALFAKLFTAEQQKLIKNVGQLLDAEDVLAVFGKPGNHPVFEISKDLV